MKKFFALALSLVTALALFTGCSSANSTITVVSREDGSGTRGAFVELMGILQDEKDLTVGTAEITNSTSVMLSTVAGNKNAIGYVSMGSLNDTVKALDVDGVAATVENINNGTYPIARPFNIATKEGLSELAQDFINFILSADGQAIIEEKGYISAASGTPYTASGLTGSITLAGSTSVAPVMEVLADAYKALNSGVTIEVQQSGSSAGMTSAIEGVCDIGMSSRELKQSELDAGLTATMIARDGIAVIVHPESSVSGLTSDQIQKIFTGAITDWADVQ